MASKNIRENTVSEKTLGPVYPYKRKIFHVSHQLSSCC